MAAGKLIKAEWKTTSPTSILCCQFEPRDSAGTARRFSSAIGQQVSLSADLGHLRADRAHFANYCEPLPIRASCLSVAAGEGEFRGERQPAHRLRDGAQIGRAHTTASSTQLDIP